MEWKLDCDQSKDKYLFMCSKIKLPHNEDLMDIMFQINIGTVSFPVIMQRKKPESMVLLQALWKRSLICLLLLEIKTTMKE